MCIRPVMVVLSIHLDTENSVNKLLISGGFINSIHKRLLFGKTDTNISTGAHSILRLIHIVIHNIYKQMMIKPLP